MLKYELTKLIHRCSFYALFVSRESLLESVFLRLNIFLKIGIISLDTGSE